MASCEPMDSYSLVEGPIALDRGFVFAGKIEVDDGTVAVITVGGKHHVTFGPGRQSLGDLPRGSQIKAYIVSTKRRQMNFVSAGDFYVQEIDGAGTKVLAKVKVHLVVYYRVLLERARQVALETEQPVNELCKETMNAVRECTKLLTFEQFRTGGEDIAAFVKFQLELRRVDERTGLTVEDVTSLVLTGADRTAEQVIARVTGSRRPIDVRWWLETHPEHVMQLQQKYFDYILQYGGDPAAFLDRPSATTENPVLRLLVMHDAYAAASTKPTQPQFPISDSSIQRTSCSEISTPNRALTHTSAERIDEEWVALEKIGWSVDGQPGVRGERSVPDGTYVFLVSTATGNGQQLEVQLHLPVGYEQGVPPSRMVHVQGARVRFPEIDSRKWEADPNLVRLVEEVIDYYR